MSFLFCCLYGIERDLYHSDLAVIIMVKNEAGVIVQTLEPFVTAGVDCFFVYDTGSQDGTQNIIRNYFEKKNKKHAYLIEEPFVDFATSRNRCLDLAEELFPHVHFFLMIDAEWYMHGIDELLHFCALQKNYIQEGTVGGCYAIRLLTAQDGIDNYATRLFRNGKNARYSGVVHEAVQQATSGFLPYSTYFEYRPAQNGINKSRERFMRDYYLLKNYLEKNPSDERTLFYLAQTCQFLDRWEEAIEYYKKRAELGAVSEERYLALYRIGCAIEYILYGNHDFMETSHTPYDMINYYLAAHTMLPHRIEPLVRLALYYIHLQQYPVAYLFALRATQLPYPLHDTLFVEKKLYDYVRYDLLGQCALYVGEYEIGKKAVLAALEQNPDASHLHYNLSLYQQLLQ